MAAPATVSGEPSSASATGKLGRLDERRDPQARRPASAVTQPVGGEHHTERLFAAVTLTDAGAVDFFTTPRLSDVRQDSTARRAGGRVGSVVAHASFASGPVNRAPASARPPQAKDACHEKTLYICLLEYICRPLHICAALLAVPRGIGREVRRRTGCRHRPIRGQCLCHQAAHLQAASAGARARRRPLARARTITAAPTSRAPSRPVEAAPQPAALGSCRRLRAFSPVPSSPAPPRRSSPPPRSSARPG